MQLLSARVAWASVNTSSPDRTLGIPKCEMRYRRSARTRLRSCSHERYSTRLTSRWKRRSAFSRLSRPSPRDGGRSRSSENLLYILRMKKRFPHLTLMRVGSSGKLDSVWRSSDLSLIYKGGKRKTRARARGVTSPVGTRADLLWMACAGAEMVSDQALLGVFCGLSPEALCGPFLAPGR